MKPADRVKLTTALRDHVTKVADDLRAQMQNKGLRTEGVVRERAKKLHADEQVGEDFDVWTDLLARRAAVLWVLKSVYVRVLEDRGRTEGSFRPVAFSMWRPSSSSSGWRRTSVVRSA